MPINNITPKARVAPAQDQCIECGAFAKLAAHDEELVGERAVGRGAVS
jgi:hypothetical protein